MIVAVTTQDSEIFQHFGKCTVFTLFSIKNQTVQAEERLDAPPSGHAALAGFLKSHGVDAVICGGIGQGARQMLAGVGIQLIAGASGDVRQAVASFLRGTLSDHVNLQCSHHNSEPIHSCDCGKSRMNQ